MNKTRRFSAAPLAFAFLGLLFSLWTLFGNEVNFCVTAGCTLYQDFKIAGVSLWVFGAASFAVFMLLAVTGFVRTGRLLSGIALLADCGLLLLMAVTAPCLNCLIVAAFFALTYRSFRLAALAGNVQRGSGPGRSWLVAAWLVLFIMNAGAVVRSETGSWAMLGSEEDASVHMYFTPGCPSCREGLNALSGSVETAFYPMAAENGDYFKAQAMMPLLDKGVNIAEAAQQVQETAAGSFWDALSPGHLLLRLRMLRNKAHVFAAGSTKVPYFEFRGLPSMLGRRGQRRAAAQPPAQPQQQPQPDPQQSLPDPGTMPPTSRNPDLPDELAPAISGQCGGEKPCR
ncbi:MAG: hypothetical protein J5838_07820 [Desulfovibrio sp.]|nr:hypothetical protein [Desulfovibrio sp.]